jgi:hypothetical protein
MEMKIPLFFIEFTLGDFLQLYGVWNAFFLLYGF